LKALIKRTVPFPTFHAVRNELLLEELTMAHEAHTPASTLYSANTGALASSGGQAPRSSSVEAPARPPTVTPRHASTTDGGRRRRPRKGGRGGGNSSCGGTTGRGGDQHWSSFYNP
jgi:hypothetical protein